MSYTFDDLNDAVNNVDPQEAERRRMQQKFQVQGQLPDNGGGGNIWGNVAQAAVNPQMNREEMSEKLAQMKELKAKQSTQFQNKQDKLMGVQTKGLAKAGQMSLEQMNLDRGDHDIQNFDPFYNPLNNNHNGNYGPGIQLQAQNKYMGKETAERQNFWSPEAQAKEDERQRLLQEQKQRRNEENELDDLDDLEDLGQNQQYEYKQLAPQQQYPGGPPPSQEYQQMEMQHHGQMQDPGFHVEMGDEIDLNAQKKKKKKKKKKADRPTREEDENEQEQQRLMAEQHHLQQQQQEMEMERQQLEEEEYQRQLAQQELEEQEDRIRREAEEAQLAMQQQQEVLETEKKLLEIQKKQEELEAEQARLEDLARQQEQDEAREEDERQEFERKLADEKQRLEQQQEQQQEGDSEEYGEEEEQIQKEKAEFDKQQKKKKQGQHQQEEEKGDGGQQQNYDEEEDEEEEDAGFLENAPAYYQPGIVPQAPLKPSQRDAYDAFISKLLNPYLPLDELRDLYMKPLPALIGQVQMTIIRSKSGFNRLWPQYTLSLSNGNKYLLTGKKRGMNATSNYMITIEQKKFEKESNGYLGKVRSNFLGTEFSIFDCKENPKKVKNRDDARCQHGVVQYETNVLGSKGPRRMKVLLPMVNREGKEMQWLDNEVEKETIQGKFADNKAEEIMFFFNKPPKWNEQVQAFVLNFNGRVDKASVKNFQLIDEYDDNKIYMQFGRIGKDQFNVDCAFPCSIFQAFGIALSSFDFKFACE